MATSLGSAVLEIETDDKKLKQGLSAAKKDVQQSLKGVGMAMTPAGAGRDSSACRSQGGLGSCGWAEPLRKNRRL